MTAKKEFSSQDFKDVQTILTNMDTLIKLLDTQLKISVRKNTKAYHQFLNVKNYLNKFKCEVKDEYQKGGK